MLQSTVKPPNKTTFPTECYISFVDLFYIPSFLRGEGGNRMAVLEHRRSVVRTGACQVVGMSVCLASKVWGTACLSYQRPDHHIIIAIRMHAAYTLLTFIPRAQHSKCGCERVRGSLLTALVLLLSQRRRWFFEICDHCIFLNSKLINLSVAQPCIFMLINH